MHRREFITLIGGAAVALPLSARAQQSARRVIGFLCSTSPGPYAPFLAAFHQGLNEEGYVEGQNIAIEYRWAEGQYDRLPALAADLLRHQVALIVAGDGGVTALAAKAATSTVPIVFANGSDPVKLGLVSSLNQPGGNITGASNLAVALASKRLGLLRDLLPGAAAVGFLMNAGSPNVTFDLQDMHAAARTLKQQLIVVHASSEREINMAFLAALEQRADALIVQAEPFFFSRRDQIVTLAMRHALPAMYFGREFVAAGGLVSYGAEFKDANRHAGVYAGRILNGAKPADLPVVQPTKFELVINLKTVKALDLTLSPSLLARADEVIE
jgi:putative tryptophan/tyrosine transport system substrate-binding protein